MTTEFSEPDLPKMKLHEAFNLDEMKKELPELRLPSVLDIKMILELRRGY